MTFFIFFNFNAFLFQMSLPSSDNIVKHLLRGTHIGVFFSRVCREMQDSTKSEESCYPDLNHSDKQLDSISGLS